METSIIDEKIVVFTIEFYIFDMSQIEYQICFILISKNSYIYGNSQYINFIVFLL